MAKVTAPFFGFHARNQINKTLVYFVWKGINAVRSWVIPANPNSEGQQGVRNDFIALVAEWHGTNLVDADKVAWNRDATTVKYKPQSGFNRFIGAMRNLIDVAGGRGISHHASCTVVDPGAMEFSSKVTDHDASDTAALVYGVHTTALIHSVAGTWSSEVSEWGFGPVNTSYQTGTIMYWKIRIYNVGGDLKSETGIYKTTCVVTP